MAVLEARGVTKRYAERRVLEGVSFDLHGGEMVLVQGRSGTGKSTLLHIVAGMERADTGSVRLLGHDVTGLGDDERAELRLAHVGFVFQHFNLIPDLNAWENVALPIRLAGGRHARDRARALLASLGLAERADSFPATLSGGEMQRVAIARALANDPAVVLADEPTANLDEENARAVLAELEAIAAAGRLVVVASHDPLLLEARARRLTLREGRLVPLEGSPPAPEVVARGSPRSRSP